MIRQFAHDIYLYEPEILINTLRERERERVSTETYVLIINFVDLIKFCIETLYLLMQNVTSCYNISVNYQCLLVDHK